MKKSIFILLILVMTISLFAQNECNCEQSLGKLIIKMESEYPGFKEKTPDKRMYDSFKDGLIIKSQNTVDSNCFELLNDYLSYFRDPHVQLIQNNQSSDESPSTAKSSIKVNINLDDFYKYIAQSNDELEGVWESTYYKVGIKKIDSEYQGFVIETSSQSWKANEIKFSLMQNEKANYYMGNHSLNEGDYEIFDASILLFKSINAVFVKKSPKPRLTESEINSKLDRINGFYFTKLTDRTSLLCISSFQDAYVEKIEKMVSDNKEAIENSENLIIDLRNNLGGTYDAYDEILPYILTNATRSVGTEFLATQTLIDDVEAWFDDEAGKKMARAWITMFEGNIGKFVNVDSSDVSEAEIKIAEKSPKQIVVLANKLTASSGEAFVMEAKQSKKVKILGVPTYGAMDYGSATYFDFGCENYTIMLPTWRAMRLPDYPIDNIGIQPDIYLDKSVKDWVQFALDYLEN